MGVTTIDENTEYHRWAEEQFVREYPDAVRAPPGSPYDFAVGHYQVEVKGIALTTHEGSRTRRGRVFITVENHKALGLLPNACYVIFIDGNQIRRKVLTWEEMDKLIRSYKTFTRNTHPKDAECVKIGYKKLSGFL
jgi:hypothetical protein